MTIVRARYKRMEDLPPETFCCEAYRTNYAKLAGVKEFDVVPSSTRSAHSTCRACGKTKNNVVIVAVARPDEIGFDVSRLEILDLSEGGAE